LINDGAACRSERSLSSFGTPAGQLMRWMYLSYPLEHRPFFQSMAAQKLRYRFIDAFDLGDGFGFQVPLSEIFQYVLGL